VTISLSAAAAKAGLDAQFDLANSGSMRVYSGTAPTDAKTGLSGNTLLAQLAMGSTAFGAAAGTTTITKTANAITADTDADATGTATFFRLYKSDGTTVVCQGTVSASGGGGDAIINSTSVVQHTTVSCSSMVFTAGA
jgi:hypothetical protein